MLTIKELLAGTKRIRGGMPIWQGARLKATRTLVKENDNEIVNISIIRSATDPRSKYRTVIKFKEINNIEKLGKGEICTENAFKVVSTSSKQTYCVTKIDLNTTPVECRCNCTNFYHMFAFWVKKAKALYGGPLKKYKRKTPPPSKGGRPPVNPLKVPGMCKHLILLLKGMEQNGWFKQSIK